MRVIYLWGQAIGFPVVVILSNTERNESWVKRQGQLWQSCSEKKLGEVSTYSFKNMYKHLVRVVIVVDSGTCDKVALEAFWRLSIATSFVGNCLVLVVVHCANTITNLLRNNDGKIYCTGHHFSRISGMKVILFYRFHNILFRTYLRNKTLYSVQNKLDGFWTVNWTVQDSSILISTTKGSWVSSYKGAGGLGR